MVFLWFMAIKYWLLIIKSVITVHHSKGTLNANFIISCRKDLVPNFTISCVFQCVHTSPNFGLFFHFSLWLAKWDWELKTTAMLDFTKMLCSTFSSLIKDAFSQKRPLDSFTFLHQLSVTLYTTVSKFCFCSEQPYGWILHFTSHDVFTSITTKLVLKYQYSFRNPKDSVNLP